MGKLTDALRRAEEERRRRRLEGSATLAPPTVTNRPEPVPPPPPAEPAPFPPSPPAARDGQAQPSPPTRVPAAPPGRGEGTEVEAPAPIRQRLKEPAAVPAPLERSPGRSGPDQRLICFHNRHDTTSEQFRTLRTNLLALNREAAPPRMIVVTSHAVGEGKSLTAANLAVALADYVAGPVLAVDGDLRKPALHSLFGLQRAPGLSEVLNGHASLEDALQASCVPNLRILAAGRSVDNPTGLLGSERAVALWAEARRLFSHVIIDTPPVGTVTDATIVGAQADGALLVILAGKTRREEARRGLDGLAAGGVTVLGTVLNRMRHYIPGYIYRRL